MAQSQLKIFKKDFSYKDINRNIKIYIFLLFFFLKIHILKLMNLKKAKF
ncbi:MAG: hypothetical protein Ct9H300mP5_1280 [Candidatus Pelagibacterales bacterium]|nr:MAG: hypothetical protein Ct9H300mP5_1280 [Pelagibacterales bacterium]